MAVSCPVGGHNLLEPAALGVPILTGPHNFNSADIARLLIERGAAEVVHNRAELADASRALFADPAGACAHRRARRATASTATAARWRSCSALIEPLLAVPG